MDTLNDQDLRYGYRRGRAHPAIPDPAMAPDARAFDAQRRTDVLDLLNEFCRRFTLTKRDGIKAEWLIRKHMPPSLMTRGQVIQWLNLNWTRY